MHYEVFEPDLLRSRSEKERRRQLTLVQLAVEIDKRRIGNKVLHAINNA